ncbi:MAG: hypothetical protein Q8N60_04835 [Candidatus Diapherotrites archaeon]|nr:hypothetical protein [Candidatus Diapherotrites archaeon]
MPYWNELVTEKSWQKLLELRQRKISFVLIGGWAAWLYTKSLKSKDIDIMVSFSELSKLRQLFDLTKNERLKKYQFRLDEIDVDVYVEHFSLLTIPAEEAMKETTQIEGFTVVKPEILLVLKQGAEEARQKSEKGLKDRIDIIELLLKAGINFSEYNKALQKHGIGQFKQRLIEILQNFSETKYLNLNPREFKKKKQQLLREIKESR